MWAMVEGSSHCFLARQVMYLLTLCCVLAPPNSLPGKLFIPSNRASHLWSDRSSSRQERTEPVGHMHSLLSNISTALSIPDMHAKTPSCRNTYEANQVGHETAVLLVCSSAPLRYKDETLCVKETVSCKEAANPHVANGI